MKIDRFYREPDPIGIGSIVIRFNGEGTSFDIGQIVAADPSIRAGARWMVFCDGKVSRWHAATILRKLKDWEEAAFVRGAAAAIDALTRPAPDHLKIEFHAAARATLEAIGNGEFKA